MTGSAPNPNQEKTLITPHENQEVYLKQLMLTRAATEITSLALTTSNLNELLQKTVDQISRQLGYIQVSIFLLDASGQYATLSVVTGASAEQIRAPGVQVVVDSNSMVGWVAKNNQPRIIGDVTQDPFLQKDELILDTRSEAAFPLSVGLITSEEDGEPTGQKIENLGVLVVKHNLTNAFDADVISILQLIANHIAAWILNHRLQVEVRNGSDEASVLYRASQELANADRIDDIREAVSRALLVARYPALLLTVQQEADSDEEVLIPYNSSESGSAHPYFAGRLPVDLPGFNGLRIDTSLLNHEGSSTSEEFGQSFVDCMIMEFESPNQDSSPLGDFARRLGFVSAAFIPVSHIKHLDLLLLLGSTQEKLTRDQMQAYISLADLTRNAFERVYTMQVLEKRLTTLQSLNVISQAVALQADLNKLYRVIHNEVRQLLGEVTFFIAIYDAMSNMVEIPYLFELGSDQAVQPPPFALGMGLTSLVIQKRQPILLVEDTTRRLQELGAQQVGLPAKSWMGVPMLVAGEVTGAIVIQDLYHEHRFDEDDLQMMVTMASQVAVTVRYVDLLKSARLQAERERALNEITAQIRASSDAQKILQTAAREVARVVGARRTRFVLSPVNEERIEEHL